MAVTRRLRKPSRRGSVKRRTARTTRRKAGAYGLYRGTTAMGTLRAASRAYSIGRSLTPFPNTKLVRHKYCDQITIPAGAAAGLSTLYQFRCNSMFDPDYTGVGHQPMFRDEMAAQYTYYTVLSSKIKFTFTASNTQELIYQLWVDDDVTVAGAISENCEQHSSRVEKLSTRSSSMHMKASYNAAKWNKTTQSGLMADDQHKTAVGSNPQGTVQKYYNLYISPLVSTSTVSTIPVRVEAFFYTLWRQPVDHVGS